MPKIFQELLSMIKDYKNFQIVEETTNGYIVSYVTYIPCIDEEGNRKLKEVTKYNFFGKNGELPCQDGFDYYEKCENEDIIIGIKRSELDYEKAIEIYTFSGNITKEKYQYLYGVINRRGIYVIPAIYDFIEDAKENAVIATHTLKKYLYPKQGYISTTTGKHITPIKFHKAYPFSEEMGRVIINKDNELTGFVERNKPIEDISNPEEYAFPPFRGTATDFINGKSQIKTSSHPLIPKEEVIINNKGQTLERIPKRIKTTLPKFYRY